LDCAELPRQFCCARDDSSTIRFRRKDRRHYLGKHTPRPILHKMEENAEAASDPVGPSMMARNSPTGPLKSWLRYAVPSVGGLVFVLLLAVLSCGTLAQGLLGDAGIGWHILTGEWIRRAHAVPRVDPFSSIMQGKPWFAWEWLYD